MENWPQTNNNITNNMGDNRNDIIIAIIDTNYVVSMLGYVYDVIEIIKCIEMNENFRFIC